MITWQEADRTTNVHVYDFESGEAHAVVSYANRSVQRASGHRAPRGLAELTRPFPHRFARPAARDRRRIVRSGGGRLRGRRREVGRRACRTRRGRWRA